MIDPNIKSYPNYKPSGIEWIDDVPVHWEVLPNRAIFVEVNEQNWPDEQMLSVTIVNGVIRQEELLENTSKKDSSRLDKAAYKLVQPGDIAYNKMRAWQGAVGASEYRGIISPAYVVQRPRNGNNSHYLHHLLRTPAFSKEAERWSYGITSDMWSLRPEHFKMIYTCVPPLPEQTAIVRFLDHADRRIQHYIRVKQKLIALLEEQKQAIIDQAVTGQIDVRTGQLYPAYKPSGVEWLGDVPVHWEVRRLRTVAEMRVSNVDKHTKEDELPVRLCNYVDVYQNDCITQGIPFMKATASQDEIERFRLKQGDVLITKDSEAWDDIGVPALVTEPADDLISGYHLALLRPLSQMLGTYLARTLQSKAVARQFHISAKGVTRYGLTHAGIQLVNLPLPPLSEQTAIVAYLDKTIAAIDTSISRTFRQMELLQEYRPRLIADVVTGKLDVREVAAELPEVAPLAEDDLDGTIHDEDNSNLGGLDAEKSAAEYTIAKEMAV